MNTAGHPRKNDALESAPALLDALLRVAQLVRLRFNDWLDHFELNDGRHAVLVALARSNDEGFSQAELAIRLGQSESNVSTLIERMQRDGLVDRSRSIADRRKRVLRITETGKSTLDAVNARRASWAADLLKGIPGNERTMLVIMLERLGCSLEPTFEIPMVLALPKKAATEPSASTVSKSEPDPVEDPESPQFALRRMLLELSSASDVGSYERGAA